MTATQGVTAEGKLSAHALSNTGPRRFLIIEFDFDASHSAEEACLFEGLASEGRDVKDLCAALLLHLAERAPTCVGGSQWREISARMVLLRRRTRANRLVHFPIRCFVGSRSCKLDAFTVCTNARWTAGERQPTNRLFSQSGGGQMKLADSWVGEPSTTVPAARLYDE